MFLENKGENRELKRENEKICQGFPLYRMQVYNYSLLYSPK
jgi:hypothetical protein